MRSAASWPALASATRPLNVKPSRVHRGLVPRLGMLVPPSARQRPRRPAHRCQLRSGCRLENASWPTSRGIRRHRLTAVCLRRATPTGALVPSIREIRTCCHPAHMAETSRRSSRACSPGGRDQSGRGCIRGYAWCRACRSGAGCGLTWGCASLSCNSGRSDAPEGRWGPAGRTKGLRKGCRTSLPCRCPVADPGLRGVRRDGCQLLRHAIAGP